MRKWSELYSKKSIEKLYERVEAYRNNDATELGRKGNNREQDRFLYQNSEVLEK